MSLLTITLPFRLRNPPDEVTKAPLYQGRMFPDNGMVTSDLCSKKKGREEMLKSKFASLGRRIRTPVSPSSLAGKEKIRKRTHTDGFFTAKMEKLREAFRLRSPKRKGDDEIQDGSGCPLRSLKMAKPEDVFGSEGGADEASLSSSINEFFLEPAKGSKEDTFEEELNKLANMFDDFHVRRPKHTKNASVDQTIENLADMILGLHIRDQASPDVTEAVKDKTAQSDRGGESAQWTPQFSDKTPVTANQVSEHNKDEKARPCDPAEPAQHMPPIPEDRKVEPEEGSVPKSKKTVRFAKEIQIIGSESKKPQRKEHNREHQSKASKSDRKKNWKKIKARKHASVQESPYRAPAILEKQIPLESPLKVIAGVSGETLAVSAQVEQPAQTTTVNPVKGSVEKVISIAGSADALLKEQSLTGQQVEARIELGFDSQGGPAPRVSEAEVSKDNDCAKAKTAEPSLFPARKLAGDKESIGLSAKIAVIRSLTKPTLISIQSRKYQNSDGDECPIEDSTSSSATTGKSLEPDCASPTAEVQELLVRDKDELVDYAEDIDFAKSLNLAMSIDGKPVTLSEAESVLLSRSSSSGSHNVDKPNAGSAASKPRIRFLYGQSDTFQRSQGQVKVPEWCETVDEYAVKVPGAFETSWEEPHVDEAVHDKRTTKSGFVKRA